MSNLAPFAQEETTSQSAWGCSCNCLVMYKLYIFALQTSLLDPDSLQTGCVLDYMQMGSETDFTLTGSVSGCVLAPDCTKAGNTLTCDFCL